MFLDNVSRHRKICLGELEQPSFYCIQRQKHPTINSKVAMFLNVEKYVQVNWNPCSIVQKNRGNNCGVFFFVFVSSKSVMGFRSYKGDKLTHRQTFFIIRILGYQIVDQYPLERPLYMSYCSTQLDVRSLKFQNGN